MTSSVSLTRLGDSFCARPLERLSICFSGDQNATLSVCDALGREYFRAPAAPETSFVVGGAAGTHGAVVQGEGGEILARTEFAVEAQTFVDDGGAFSRLFEILKASLHAYSPTGEHFREWKGRPYVYFVPWILDHFHTAKGMRYFSPHTGSLVEMLALLQREDGMIWSFIKRDHGPGFFDTRDGGEGYTERRDGLLLVRQPSENHCEANFVSALFLAWQEKGDDQWMKAHLDAACRALDYVHNSPLRWSEKFGLLKRGYTIDSWDFQVEDEYSVPFPVGTEMKIDGERTKFGVFYGDNTGYAFACDQLAQMLSHAGREDDTSKFRERADEVRERLNGLTWNGHFFCHRVEEDLTVVRDLGVDEASQISFSNLYSLNRGVEHEQCAAILRMYQEIKEHLPPGSPGEWYAIHPPFERGFGPHSGKWQYMNGGVHPHAAGEGARGAFEHGFETYGADILRRLGELGQKHDGKLPFAFTGAFEAPPTPKFTPLDLSGVANMGLGTGGEGVPGWMGEKEGNDLSGLPTGVQCFAGVPFGLPFQVPFQIADGHRAALAVSCGSTGELALPERVEVPLPVGSGKNIQSLCVLHTAGNLGASGIAGALRWSYEDGNKGVIYLQGGKHLTSWWFPSLDSSEGGVAWRGPNALSTDVGVCYAILPNPHPEKSVRALEFEAALDGAIYALLGATLADQPIQPPASPVSFGGPDNWTGGTVMAALLEGLAGVGDEGTAFETARISPRWSAADVSDVRVCARYGSSGDYVAYEFGHDPHNHEISLQLTGSGKKARVRLLLPGGAKGVVALHLNGRDQEFALSRIEASCYADFWVDLPGPINVRLYYSL